MSNGPVVTPPTSRPLARAYEHLTAGRVPEAAGAYRATLQIDPSEPQAHAGLGHCAFLRNQPREAYEHFVRAAGLWREREDSVAALGCYTHAVACDPSELDIHVEIAELEAELGHTDAARQRLENLAENYLASGRHDDAVAILEFVNQWEEPTAAAAPEPEPAPAPVDAPLPDFAPEMVRDTEGTMVISTFLLTPDGRPFVPIAAAPAPEPPRADSIPLDVSMADDDDDLALDDDEEADATATRPTPLHADEPASDADDDIPDEALFSAGELDAIDLVPDLFAGEPVEEREATTVRPIPIAAMPPRQPAPTSRDSQGRTLAERLRTTRARAAAPTAPHPTTTKPVGSPPRATATKPTTTPRPAAAATPAARPAAAPKPAVVGKPTAVGKPPASGRVAAPAAQPARPTTTPRPATPARTSTPTPSATAKPAAKPATRAPAAATRPGIASRSAPTPSRPTAAAPSKPAGTTTPRPATPASRAPKPASPPARAAAPAAAPKSASSTARQGAAKPAARQATPPGRAEPRRGAEPNKRVMAVRTRSGASSAGVPTPVAAGRTLPLVIPPPPVAEELDDSRTVLYQSND